MDMYGQRCETLLCSSVSVWGWRLAAAAELVRTPTRKQVHILLYSSHLVNLKLAWVCLLKLGCRVLLQCRRVSCMKHQSCSTRVQAQTKSLIWGRFVI